MLAEKGWRYLYILKVEAEVELGTWILQGQGGNYLPRYLPVSAYK